MEPGRRTILEDTDAKAWVLRHLPIHDQPRALHEDTPEAAARAVEHRPPLDHAGRYLAGLDAERARLDIKTMVLEAHEPLWSMGDDTPTAGRGRLDRPIADHLRQAFAQVTNPAIDPERERVVMDLRVELGRRPALLGGPPRGPRTLRLERPIVADLARVVGRSRRSRDARPDARRDLARFGGTGASGRRARGTGGRGGARRGVGRGGPHRQRRRALGRSPAGPVDPGRGRHPHRAHRCRPARTNGHRRGRRGHPRCAFDGDGPRGRCHGRSPAARPGARGGARGDARRGGDRPGPRPSGTSSPRSRRACARPSRGWASARSRATSAGRSSTPSTWRPTSSRAVSRTRRRGRAGRPSPTSANAPCVVERRPWPCPRPPPAASRACRTRAGRASGPMARRISSHPASPRRSRSCPGRSKARPPPRRSMPRSRATGRALGRGADAPAVPRDELRVRRASVAARAR